RQRCWRGSPDRAGRTCTTPSSCRAGSGGLPYRSKNSLAVFKHRVGEVLIQAVRIAGFISINGERRWRAGKPIHALVTSPYPDASLAIFHQRFAAVAAQAGGVAWIVPIPRELPAPTVELQHAVGSCGQPHHPALVFENSPAFVQARRFRPFVEINVGC